VPDPGQRRQLVEGSQAEVVQEAPGGAEQGRPAEDFLVADDLDPAPLLERLDDAGRDGYPADLLDVPPGDRLPVGDDREGLERGPRVARRALVAQPLQVAGEFRPGLEA